jgi:hypothetical protein
MALENATHVQKLKNVPNAQRMKSCFFVLILTTFMFCCSSSSEMDSDLEDIMQGMVIEKDALPSFSGEFMAAAHPTEGNAYVNSDKTKLEIIDFKSDGGPVLELYLATDLDATQYITLGELKGLEGNFVYDLPNQVNFETHKYLMVWCVDFSVNFGHAILE